jgi:hypothetical protein
VPLLNAASGLMREKDRMAVIDLHIPAQMTANSN